MMVGEVGFDDLSFAQREFIQASMDPMILKSNDTKFTIDGQNIAIPKYLINPDINSNLIQPLYPGTERGLLVLFIFFVAILVNNLLVGLAVDDVQVVKNLIWLLLIPW